MFKLVKLLGRFVGKMYNREAKLLAKKSDVLAKAADDLQDAADRAHVESVESREQSKRIALQGQTIGKFFE